MRNTGLVRRRLVLQLYGYQSTPPDRHHRRFVRDIEQFGRTWSVTTALGPAAVEPEVAHWPVRVSGVGWETRTDYRILRVDDLIAERHRAPLLGRMLRGYAGLVDFVLDRAMARYVRYAWRYAVLTVLPLVFAGLALLAALAAGLAAHAAGGLALALLGGAGAFAACLLLANRYAFLMPMLDDWAFASVLVRRLEPGIAQRLSAAGRRIADESERELYDEVLVVGHSLGAVLAFHLVEGLAAAGVADRARITVLTLGSSLLKIGLHSAARDLRRAVTRVAGAPNVVWIDYQSRIDILNFPGVDPAVALGVRAERPPIVRAAPFSKMLEPAAYRRLYFDLYRCHSQFVRAGTRRAPYDYFMFTCGPFLLTDLVATRGGPSGKLSLDGALL